MTSILFQRVRCTLALRDKIQTRSMFSKIRIARTKGEWTSGYCKRAHRQTSINYLTFQWANGVIRWAEFPSPGSSGRTVDRFRTLDLPGKTGLIRRKCKCSACCVSRDVIYAFFHLIYWMLAADYHRTVVVLLIWWWECPSLTIRAFLMRWIDWDFFRVT